MRPFYPALVFAALILAACAATPEALLATPRPTSAPTQTAIPTSIPALQPRRAPVLRVAVLGQATTTNVWMLFDESGADYWNYATQANYWPRLYHLAPPSLRFEPATAKGEPSTLVCVDAICTATVTLQPGLTWTDGSPFTAHDAAFTVNTALQFRLGLNWQRAYSPDVLDHAKALNDSTIKFYFNGAPTVTDWQYGVLQGPIVNRAYWQPRIVDAVNLLPDESLLPTIQELEEQFADMQARVDELNLSLDTMAPASKIYQDTTKQSKRLQDELNSIANKIEKNRAAYEQALTEARASLYSLANANEPTLGPWQFASRIAGSFENRVNLGTPSGDPWFDRVHYITYPDEATAVKALLGNEVDLILTPDGLSSSALPQLEGNAEIALSRNATRSARFLAFNHSRAYLDDPVLHQALACVIDPQMLVDKLDDRIAPMPGFVLDDFWQNAEASLPCTGLTGDARLAKAVDLLKAGGYSWITEPAGGEDVFGLTAPNGKMLPRFQLLTPLPSQDTLRAATADIIVQQAGALGVIFKVQQTDRAELLYAVYGSGDYDVAMLGWRLSAYPAYLCEWFIPLEQNPFAYNGSRPALSAQMSGGEGLGTACEAWGQTGDLEQAKAHVFDIQSILTQDLPLIPLYTVLRVDAYRNVSYPFTGVVDGLSSLYGAPVLAIPNP
jgi:ABC-type transport system substrate-binding protein